MLFQLFPKKGTTCIWLNQSLHTQFLSCNTLQSGPILFTFSTHLSFSFPFLMCYIASCTLFLGRHLWWLNYISFCICCTLHLICYHTGYSGSFMILLSYLSLIISLWRAIEIASLIILNLVYLLRNCLLICSYFVSDVISTVISNFV